LAIDLDTKKQTGSVDVYHPNPMMIEFDKKRNFLYVFQNAFVHGHIQGSFGLTGITGDGDTIKLTDTINPYSDIKSEWEQFIRGTNEEGPTGKILNDIVIDQKRNLAYLQLGLQRGTSHQLSVGHGAVLVILDLSTKEFNIIEDDEIRRGHGLILEDRDLLLIDWRNVTKIIDISNMDKGEYEVLKTFDNYNEYRHSNNFYGYDKKNGLVYAATNKQTTWEDPQGSIIVYDVDKLLTDEKDMQSISEPTQQDVSEPESSGGCGAGTVLVDGVCQLSKVTTQTGPSYDPLFYDVMFYYFGIIAVIAVGGGIIGVIFAVRKRSKTPKPVKQKPKLVKQKPKPVKQKPAKKKETSTFCENCGNTLNPKAKFCGGCGTSVS
jgi:hypothetical protein